MESHNPLQAMKEEETNPVCNPEMTVAAVAATDNANLEQQQQQLVAPADKTSSSLLNTSIVSGVVEKDEKMILSTTTTMAGGFQKFNFNKAIRVKKAKAKRPSLHAFYKQAAMAAAARLERRTSTTARNTSGSRRENTNIVTYTTGNNGGLIKSTQKKPRFSTASSSSSSVNILADGSSGSRRAVGKRKSNRNTDRKSPATKKHKKAAPPSPIDTATNNHVSTSHTPSQLDHPEGATIQSNTNNSSTPNSWNRQLQARKPRIKNTPVSVTAATAAAAVAARAASMTTLEERVELPYRPDSAELKVFPIIPLPRSIDVVLGRGSRIAKHK
jgi:hypothetical protein